LLALVAYTASHAINLVGHNANFGQDNALAPILYFGIAVVEVMALVTAVLLMTNMLRATQEPAAILLEVTWVIFAALNLIASFSIDHDKILPPLVNGWVNWGLPVSALVVGVEYYLILRLNPNLRRIQDQKELEEQFAQAQHEAEVEVLNSDQMRVVLRQMKWQTMPDKVGQMLGLTEAQINYVKKFAPQLFDGDGNGVPDIIEGNRPSLPSGQEQPGPVELPPSTDGNGVQRPTRRPPLPLV
jgi:hypothetical protein